MDEKIENRRGAQVNNISKTINEYNQKALSKIFRTFYVRNKISLSTYNNDGTSRKEEKTKKKKDKDGKKLRVVSTYCTIPAG